MLSIDRATTCSASRAVTSVQNARVISRRRSARAAVQLFAARLALRLRRTFQRLEPAAAIEQPLQIETRAVVVRDIRIDDLPQLTGLHDHELLDVIGAGVAALGCNDREARRGTPLLDRRRRILPRLELGESQAVCDALRNRIVQRQLDGLPAPRAASARETTA